MLGAVQVIGQSILGGVGVAAGATAGAFMSGDSNGTLPGALIGGTAGFLAIPVAKKIGSGAIGASGMLGEKIMDGIKSTATWGEESAVANFAKSAASNVGNFAGGAVAGFGTESKMAMLASPIQRYTTAAKGFTEKLVKLEGDADSIHDVKFSKFGKALIAGMGVVQGISEAKDELMRTHMGQIDPYVHGPTPQIPAYQMNAGATGDLVFALNANRRG